MMPKTTLLFVGISLLGLLSLAYCVPNAVDAKDMLTKMNSKRQSSIVNNTCVQAQIAAGSVSFSCIIGITFDAISNTTTTLCSSTCNSLYAASVKCFGAAQTRTNYAVLCTNGYQGAAAQLNFNYAILLVSALVAALFRVVA